MKMITEKEALYQFYKNSDEKMRKMLWHDILRGEGRDDIAG